MDKTIKKTVLIDLYGVLNDYRGNFDKDFIPPANERAKEFIENLSKCYTIKIFTTRNRLLASKWLINNNLDEFVNDITNIKEPCWVCIDDRCITFNGDFSELKNRIDNFSPWYK